MPSEPELASTDSWDYEDALQVGCENGSLMEDVVNEDIRKAYETDSGARDAGMDFENASVDTGFETESFRHKAEVFPSPKDLPSFADAATQSQPPLPPPRSDFWQRWQGFLSFACMVDSCECLSDEVSMPVTISGLAYQPPPAFVHSRMAQSPDPSTRASSPYVDLHARVLV
jgi:hypothetical protein